MNYVFEKSGMRGPAPSTEERHKVSERPFRAKAGYVS